MSRSRRRLHPIYTPHPVLRLGYPYHHVSGETGVSVSERGRVQDGSRKGREKRSVKEGRMYETKRKVKGRRGWVGT